MELGLTQKKIKNAPIVQSGNFLGHVMVMKSKDFWTKYNLLGRIPRHSFGVLMMGENLAKKEKVVLRFESGVTRHPTLEYEREVLRRLAWSGQSEVMFHIPPVLDFFCYNNCLCLVMPFVGPSIDVLLRRFPVISTATACYLSLQFLQCLKVVHESGFIHQDVRPGNFLLGSDNKIQITDFGLAKPVKTKNDVAKIYYDNSNELDPEKILFGLVGSRRYASLRSHRGMHQNAQDDLISLGFTIAHVFSSKLPWQGLATEAAVESLKNDLEKDNYMALCKNLDSPNRDVLMKYFQYLLNYWQEGNFDYSKLSRFFLCHQPTPGFIFEWEKK